MDNKIYIADHLKDVSRSLAGVSQLLRHTYEMQHQEGLDAEYLTVLDDLVCKCTEDLLDLTKKL